MNAVREAYFAELSSSGSLTYGSFAGGYITTPPGYPPLTIGTGITNSPSGTIYISGATTAASFPVTDGGLRNGMGGQADGFVVSFAPSALSITTPSLLPAAPIQIPYGVALSAFGGTAPYTWSKVGFEIPKLAPKPFPNAPHHNVNQGLGADPADHFLPWVTMAARSVSNV